MPHRSLLSLLLGAALAIGGSPSTATAAEGTGYQVRPVADTSLGDILQDVQKIRSSESHLYLVIWTPSAFWAKAMQSSGENLESKEIRRTLALFDTYTVVVGMKTTQDIGGDDEYADAEELRRLLRLIGDDGRPYAPLEGKEINGEMKLMIAMLGQMLRQIDEKNADQMHILVFPGKDAAGKRFGDATAAGSLRFEMDGQQFVYRLPLGSLLKPKTDPGTGESFPGNYDYNPYTGAKLETAPASK